MRTYPGNWLLGALEARREPGESSPHRRGRRHRGGHRRAPRARDERGSAAPRLLSAPEPRRQRGQSGQFQALVQETRKGSRNKKRDFSEFISCILGLLILAPQNDYEDENTVSYVFIRFLSASSSRFGLKILRSDNMKIN